MNGLDDLRGWTLRGSIQEHIDIYVSAFTLKGNDQHAVEVQRSFPYLVAKEFATGGGDIPEFRWHIIKENEPFRIEGIDFDITPIAVHHGRLFTNSEAGPPGFTPTPNDTPGMSRTATPPKSHLGLHLHGSAAHSRHSSTESLETRHSPSSPKANGQSFHISEPAPRHSSVLQSQPISAKPKPYICYGFVVGDFMVYISDVSHIPPDAWQTIERHHVVDPRVKGSPESSMRDSSLPRVNPYKMLVVDCLKLEPHTSHFGIENVLATAKRLNATRTYMVGFDHGLPHSDWVSIGEALEGKNLSKAQIDRPHVKRALEMLSLPKEGEGVWIRPAYDSLRVFANDTEIWSEDS